MASSSSSFSFRLPSIGIILRQTMAFLALMDPSGSSIDQTAAPPGYTSQRDAASPLPSLTTPPPSSGSAEDLVSAQSHYPSDTGLDEEFTGVTPGRPSEVHFASDNRNSYSHVGHTLVRSTTDTDRRRYTSLPDGSSSSGSGAVPFPVHMHYQHQHVYSSTSPSPHISPSSDPLCIAEISPTTPTTPAAPNPASPVLPRRRNSTNYVSLSRTSTPAGRFRFLAPLSLHSRARAHADIKGDFTVDPYLHVPAALLSTDSSTPHATVGDAEIRMEQPQLKRRNLSLEVENGGIDVNIYLVGEPPHKEEIEVEGKQEERAEEGDGLARSVRQCACAIRTTLDLTIRGVPGNMFPLIAKIHASDLRHRPPFHLSASAIDGYLSLYLPPSFHGPVVITVGAVVSGLGVHIELSAGVQEKATVVMETATVRRYFVGEVGYWDGCAEGSKCKGKESGQRGVARDEWRGDWANVRIEKGRVRIQFVGEKDRDKIRKLAWKIGI